MINIKAYLADIDREITLHRQEIAARRVRISELEDTRSLMMRREEYRAEMDGQPSPFGTLPHGAQIVVREQLAATSPLAITAGPEDDEEARKRRNRAYAKKAYRRKMAAKEAAIREYSGGTVDPTKPPHKRGKHRRFTEDIKRIFLDRPHTPLVANEIVALTGVAGNKRDKQAVYQALYELKKQGYLHQTQMGEPYSLVRTEGGS